VGLPAVSALGSNKIPVSLCAPVNAQLIYNIQFASPVPGGNLELVYDWGDGSPSEIVPLTAGAKNYREERIHDFPEESGCEYIVTMIIRFNGVACSNTRQIQRISSWRTDEFNGGKIGLKSPITGTGEHLVCEGSDLSVVFEDVSVFNCNAQYVQSPPDAIESPNVGDRWQQIVYNTSIAGSRIPNVSVDGVLITSATGASLMSSYMDPRGIHYMDAPIMTNDTRRRPSLMITAPGGFGVGFPKAGDIFTITLRYWNFCNPYDDPNIPGPPTDLVNGDNRPIEKTATIKIVAPPPPPVTSNETVCFGITPKEFTVSGIVGSNTVKWYENIPNPDRPGKLIGTGKNLAVTVHPQWVSNTTPGEYKVWASQQPTTGTVTCESPKTLVTRTIREKLEVPDPTQSILSQACNGGNGSLVFPDLVSRPIGGAVVYGWLGSNGVSITSATPSSANVSIDVTDFNGKLFAERTISTSVSYVNLPACTVSKQYPVTVYKKPVGGTLSTVATTCEGVAVGNIKLTGYSGTIKQWEIKKDTGPFVSLDESLSEDMISPGILEPGSYVFRAVVSNGNCVDAYSSESTVKVLAKPALADAGQDQFHCSSLVSSPLTASSPNVGVGQWSYVSGVPAGLPAPLFSDINDPNGTISILAENAGAYTLRWTVSNGICQHVDDVVIDFGTTPSDAVAGIDQKVCGNETNLEATVPQKGIGAWTVVGGPGNCQGASCGILIENPASPISKVSVTGNVYGAYTLRWSISSGGNSCFLKTDDVIILFEKPMTAKADDTDVVCIDSKKLSPINLSGIVDGNYASAYWEKIDGKGIVSKNSSASGIVNASYTPSIDDYSAGIPIRVKLVALPQNNSACVPVEHTINIRVDRKPIAIAGADIPFICSSEIALHADAPLYGGKGSWSANSASVAFSDESDPNAKVTQLPSAPASVAATWTVTSESGFCVSDPSTIQLNRVNLPETHDLDVTECEISDGTTLINLSDYENSLTSLSPERREITWFRNQGGKTSVISNTQAHVQDGELFSANVKDKQTGCSADARLAVAVPPAPKTMSGFSSLCEDMPGSKKVAGIDLSDLKFKEAVTKEKDVVITWYLSESDAQNDLNRITAKTDVIQGKDFYARVTRNVSPFCFTVAKVTLVVNQTPSINEIFGRESVCQGDPQMPASDLPVESYQVTPIPGAKYHWEIPQGTNEFTVFGGGAKGDFYLLLQFPNVFTGKIKVRPELNGCSGPVVEKEIRVASAPVKPTIVGESMVYKNTKAVAFRVTPNNYPSSTYNWEIRRTLDNSFGGAYIIEGQSTGNILVNMLSEDIVLSVRENNAMCASATATKLVSVMEPEKPTDLVASFVASPTAACFPATVEVQNMSTGADTYTWTLANENGVVSTSNLTNPQFKISSPGKYKLQLLATHSTNGQSDQTEVSNINILDVPYAAFNVNTELIYAPDTELKFLNFSSRAETYLWSFGDGDSSSLFEPEHTYQSEGSYQITLLAGIDHGSQDINGDGVADRSLVCYDTAQIVVSARNGGYIKIPNAFSPAESGPTGGHGMSGYNDVFLPIMQGVKTYKMQIFDRWGTKIFETTNPDVGWDGYNKSGSLMSAGVYVYKIEVTLSDGSNDTRMGDVGLIR
jgi:hypothetical protein